MKTQKYILITILSIIFILIFTACKTKPEQIVSSTPVSEKEKINPWDLLSETDRLIYSISMPFFYANDLCPTTFSGIFDENYIENETERNKINSTLEEKSKKLLNITANLDTKSKTKNYALKLTSEGNNEEYYTLQHLYELDTDKNFSTAQKRKLQYALLYKDAFGKNPLKAWDYARFITCLRWGVGAKFFTENEARNYINPVLEDIKKMYSTWDEFMESFLRGAEFYDLKNENFPENSTRQKHTVQKIRAIIPLEKIKF
ncbi:MAG: DUF1266 domain-containing protein [Treponema sp.]|nr:DUF1266 domain-containing protein [Treponema sp.]